MHARNINACYVWPIDGGPTRDFPRSVRVCVVGVSTSHASKRRLAFSVSFIDATTRTACAGRVARIDEPNRNTGSFGLVQDKPLQLAERPTVQTAALLFTSPYPSTDALEILQGDPAFGALSSANYLLRNLVVYVGREPLLFSASPAHKTLGSLRALLLKLASQTSVASSAAIYGRSSEARAIRGLRYRNESHIDPDPLNSLFLFLVRNIDGSKKEPLLISVNKIGLASLEPDQLTMMVSAHEGNLLASFDCPDVDAALFQVPRQDAQIVRDRAMCPELTLDFLVDLVRIGNLGIQSNDDLSRQWELIADRSIECFVQRILSKLLRFPRQFTEAIAGFIGCLQRAQQSIGLLWRRLKLHLCG